MIPTKLSKLKWTEENKRNMKTETKKSYSPLRGWGLTQNSSEEKFSIEAIHHFGIEKTLKLKN